MLSILVITLVTVVERAVMISTMIVTRVKVALARQMEDVFEWNGMIKMGDEWLLYKEQTHN